MTFYTKDMDTLQAHASHRETVTDMVQEAIKDLIRRRGWGETREPGQSSGPETEAPTFKVTLEPEPQPTGEATGDNEPEDSPLPDWLTAAKRTRPPG